MQRSSPKWCRAFTPSHFDDGRRRGDSIGGERIHPVESGMNLAWPPVQPILVGHAQRGAYHPSAILRHATHTLFTKARRRYVCRAKRNLSHQDSTAQLTYFQFTFYPCSCCAWQKTPSNRVPPSTQKKRSRPTASSTPARRIASQTGSLTCAKQSEICLAASSACSAVNNFHGCGVDRVDVFPRRRGSLFYTGCRATLTRVLQLLLELCGVGKERAGLESDHQQPPETV